MTASEIRANARKSLAGKWGKAALLVLLYKILIIAIFFSLIILPFGSLVNFIISPVLSFGFIYTMMKLKRDEETSYIGFFQDGFNNFKKVWGIIWWTSVKMIIPIIIYCISCIILGIYVIEFLVCLISNYNLGITLSVLSHVGIIINVASLIWIICRSYFYKLARFITRDNESITSKEAVDKSAKLMKGHRWQLFWLELSFIGWFILGCIPCGIGLLWVFPYINIAKIEFYENLVKETAIETISEI